MVVVAAGRSAGRAAWRYLLLYVPVGSAGVSNKEGPNLQSCAGIPLFPTQYEHPLYLKLNWVMSEKCAV